MIGAEIHGVDLSRPLSEPAVAEVRQALNTHHVVFFRDQEPLPAQQADFARQFGEVTEGHPVIPPIEEHPEVLAIDGSDDRASWWHTDVTFLQTPGLRLDPLHARGPRGRGRHHVGQPAGRLRPTGRSGARHVRHLDRHPLRSLVRGRRRRPRRLRVAGRALRQAAARPPSGGAHPPRERPQRSLRQPPVHPDHPRAVEEREQRHPRHALPALPATGADLPVPLAAGLGGLLGQPGHPPLRPRRLRRRHPHRPPGHPARATSPTARPCPGAEGAPGRLLRLRSAAAGGRRALRSTGGHGPDTARASSLAPR